MNTPIRLILVLLPVLIAAPRLEAQFTDFVTARGDSLMDGDSSLRFISFNIPNLAYVEDNYQFAEPNPWRPADAFEITDALEAIHQIGGKVVRMYTPSVRKAMDDSSIVRHVLGPGQFDEEAFHAYDKVLEVANRIGVRVIIPFLDNWWWWGGPKEYARFRGLPASEFWTDSLLISDYKKTVEHIVNRVNTYTGVPYKDDKAILCWETGNELECPTSWNVAIAAYIKSLDPHHLVMAGSFEKLISEDYLADPNIDIVQTHHYDRPDRILDYVIVNRALAKTRKPYIVGEFGFIPTASMRTILDTVIADGTSGIMVWSMRPHNRDGGFYYHENAYRWPGFASGSTWDELAVDSLFHAEACAIAGVAPTSLPVPAPPSLLPIETPFKISWRGSTGAQSYIVERKDEGLDTAWHIIAANASDAVARYAPLFEDASVVVGHSYDYRVRAQNSSGVSDPSPAVGPVAVSYRLLVDEMQDSTLWYAQHGEMRFLTMQDLVKAREDANRVIGADGNFILYRLSDSIASVTVEAYATSSDSALAMRISSGPTPQATTDREVQRVITPTLRNEYGYFCPVLFTCTGFPPEDRYVKIALVDKSQVARIEIAYARRVGLLPPDASRERR